jgi:hypothetical protein
VPQKPEAFFLYTSIIGENKTLFYNVDGISERIASKEYY